MNSSDEFFEKLENKSAKQENKESENNIAMILKIISYIGFVVAFIYGIIHGKTKYDFDYIVAISDWLTYGCVFLMINAFGEVIKLLQDIKNNLRKS